MQHLEKPDLLALLRAARESSERDWLMILVGYWHGLRASEVVELTTKNVEGGHIFVQRKKGSLPTIHSLRGSSEPLLDEATALPLYAAKVGDGRLFPISRVQFWRLMQKYGAAVGISSWLRHPHILKHSIAMHTIKKAGVENLKAYLGHKCGSSTLEYLKVDDDTACKAIAAAIGD
jgi:integrase